MNTPVREGETIEGSRTTRNRPYPVLKCSSMSEYERRSPVSAHWSLRRSAARRTVPPGGTAPAQRGGRARGRRGGWAGCLWPLAVLSDSIKNFTTKLPRTTLGTGLARTGTNTGTPRLQRIGTIEDWYNRDTLPPCSIHGSHTDRERHMECTRGALALAKRGVAHNSRMARAATGYARVTHEPYSAPDI